MYPRHHALATALAIPRLRVAGVAWPTILQFSAASVLLDADHYLAYVWKTRDVSLRRAYRFHVGRVRRDEARFALNLHVPRLFPGRNRPLHALLVVGGALGAAAFVTSLRPLVAGMLFHRLQDYVWESARIGPSRDE